MSVGGFAQRTQCNSCMELLFQFQLQLYVGHIGLPTTDWAIPGDFRGAVGGRGVGRHNIHYLQVSPGNPLAISGEARNSPVSSFRLATRLQQNNQLNVGVRMSIRICSKDPSSLFCSSWETTLGWATAMAIQA